MDIRTYYRLYPELRKRAWQRCYAATELLRVFVARANPEPSKFYGIEFPAGSVLILPQDLYESMNMHPMVYDQAMRLLIDEGDIIVTEHNYNRIITLTHYPTNETGTQNIAPAQPEHSPTTPTQFPTNETGTQYIAPAQPEHSPTTPTQFPTNQVRTQNIAPAQPEHSPTTPTQFPTNQVGAQYIAPAQPALTENNAPHSIMPHARTRLIASAPPAHLKKHTTTSHQPPHSNTLYQHYPEKQKTTFLPHAPPHGQRPC